MHSRNSKSTVFLQNIPANINVQFFLRQMLEHTDLLKSLDYVRSIKNDLAFGFRQQSDMVKFKQHFCNLIPSFVMFNSRKKPIPSLFLDQKQQYDMNTTLKNEYKQLQSESLLNQVQQKICVQQSQDTESKALFQELSSLMKNGHRNTLRKLAKILRLMTNNQIDH